MGKDTNIQWCDSTVNPTTGCDGCELHIKATAKSPGRKSCYAGILHEGRLAHSIPRLYAKDFTEVRLAPGRMAQAARWSDLTGKERPDKPWLDGLPRMIFISDMSDALSAAVPFGYLKTEIIENIISEAGQRHNWLWLTKQPRRMAEFSSWLSTYCDWPRNLWAGTSVTSQATVSRVNALLNVGDDFTRRFVSAEPLVEAVDFGAKLGLIDWLIVGGESGSSARPFNLDWARSLVEKSRAIGTKVFVKQLGSKPCDVTTVVMHGQILGEEFEDVVTSERESRWINLNDSHGGDWLMWPFDLRVREVPQERAV